MKRNDSPDAESPDITNTPDNQDLIDLEKLRLSQNFAETVGVKKKILTVPVRKPHRQLFVRVHPDEDWRLETAVLQDKEDRETYLVSPEMWPELPGEIIPMVLFTAISRQGIVFIWPVRLPAEDGRHDAWNQSALEAAQLAIENWIRIAANMSLGAYEVFEATGNLPDPVWPDITFEQLVQIAFRGRFIDSADHPVLRNLRGEV